jgi:hypothetical protein
MRFEPGQVIVRRYLKRHVATWVQAATVVTDDDTGLLLWSPPGADFALYRDPAGRTIKDAPVDELPDAALVHGTWQRHGALMWHPPTAAAYSVWWMFTADRFDGWYVNLEAPYRRRDVGIDTMDHALDLEVDPGLRVSWKDEEEFVARTGHPWYWDERQAARIRATAEHVAGLAAAEVFPFDGTYRDFRPDPSWPVPRLPVGWDGPPGRVSTGPIPAGSPELGKPS